MPGCCSFQLDRLCGVCFELYCTTGACSSFICFSFDWLILESWDELDDDFDLAEDVEESTDAGVTPAEDADDKVGVTVCFC